MSARLIAGLALLALALGANGCLRYNEDCAPLVDNPDEIVGWLDGDVDITKARVRSGDNVIGELTADSYRHSADDVPDVSLHADIGFENSGSIRNDGVCQNYDSLPRGPVRRKTLRQVLAFDDTISVVSIDSATLKQVLEHSVAGFTEDTQPAVAVPAGSFLQISGVTAEVDCRNPAESATSPGSRITRIVLQDQVPPDGGVEGEVLFDGVTLKPRTVRIAVNSYVLTGGDGYTMLANLEPTAAHRYDEQGLNFQIAAQYFEKNHPQTAPLDPVPERRWVFTHCSGTVSP